MNKSAHISSKLLLFLINDILDLSKIENEAFKINLKFYSMISLLEEV